MSDCPLVRLATNHKLLKQFEQTGQVVMPVDDWVWFFQALTFLTRDDGRREIYCEIGARYLLFSKTPVERKARERPTQSELFERRKR